MKLFLDPDSLSIADMVFIDILLFYPCLLVSLSLILKSLLKPIFSCLNHFFPLSGFND